MSEPTVARHPPGAHGPIARSPIAAAPPVAVQAGWEVSVRRSAADLTVTDLTPLAKVQVKAPHNGAMARTLDVPHGRAARAAPGAVVAGALVTGAAPGEWLILAPPGTAPELVERTRRAADRLPVAEFVTVVDLTHGRALVRLTGERAPDVLAKICGIDLGDRATPDGAALRTSVAGLATDLVRDDPTGEAAGNRGRSYLLHCERSSGQYLYDALLDAGAEHGIEVDGFVVPGI